MWTFELFEKTKLGDLLDRRETYTKDEILDYVRRQCAPQAAIDLLEELDDNDIFEDVLDIWPDMPTDDDDFGWDKNESNILSAGD